MIHSVYRPNRGCCCQLVHRTRAGLGLVIIRAGKSRKDLPSSDNHLLPHPTTMPWEECICQLVHWAGTGNTRAGNLKKGSSPFLIISSSYTILPFLRRLQCEVEHNRWYFCQLFPQNSRLSQHWAGESRARNGDYESRDAEWNSHPHSHNLLLLHL